jgi:hypothetical protein
MSTHPGDGQSGSRGYRPLMEIGAGLKLTPLSLSHTHTHTHTHRALVVVLPVGPDGLLTPDVPDVERETVFLHCLDVESL